MKKITLVLLLFSFCSMMNAQRLSKTEKTKSSKKTQKKKSIKDRTFYIFSPDLNLVLEADNVTSELRFSKLKRGNKNQLFVFSNYMDDWDIIYNVASHNYLVKKGNQMGLGDTGEWENIKIKDGIFYIEKDGEEVKLMISKNRSAKTKSKYSLTIDVRNSNRNTKFELYSPRQYNTLLTKINKAKTPEPQKKAKPAITRISCPDAGKTIKKSTTTFSAVLANVSSRNEIKLTVNNKKVSFQFVNNKLKANNVPLVKGTNFIKLTITNSGGTVSSNRKVNYQPAPSFGNVYITLHLEKKGQKCGKGDYQVILIHKKTKEIYSTNLKNCKGSIRRIPVGDYNVQFKFMAEIDPKYAENSENGYSFLNTNCQSSISVKARKENKITCSTR